MQRIAIALMMLLVAVTATAWDTINPALLPTSYGSLDEAGVAAVQASYDYSNFYEYGGTILEDREHRFHVSIPDTDFSGDHVFIDFDNDWGDQYKTVADYHTHPCLPFSHAPGVFSSNDADSNDHRGLPGYLGDLCSGRVLRYLPGVTKRDVEFQKMQRVPPTFEFELATVFGATGEQVGEIVIYRQPVIMERAPDVALIRHW
jgi:hypothetical protein